METSRSDIGNNAFQMEAFLNLSGIELRRAERYRVFVTLILFDLSMLDELFEDLSPKILDEIVEYARERIRGSDIISSTKRSIALLIPETPRQGAEITSRRLSEQIRQRLSDLANKDIEEVIPLEMASFPDTAGARTLSDFLNELAEMSKN